MDIKIKIFKKVADKLSFTKAAQDLFITQPAVTKSIKTLEQELNIKLFIRKGNQIELTEAGIIVYNYAKNIEKQFKLLNFELSTLSIEHKGEIVIGASTTITQYILPKILAVFHNKFKRLKIKVINGNTRQIEQALLKNEISFGIIEGHSKRKEIHYQKFIEDEIILAVNSSHKLAKKEELTIEEIMKLPLIIREEGSGTREVIEHHLKQRGLRLKDFNIELELGSTEAIKNYIINSDTFALVSINSILSQLKRNELSIIDIKDCEITRDFNFIILKGQHDPIVDIFINFISHYNL